MRTRIKICGLTREADVAEAIAAGADAVGFNCYPQSPRYVPPSRLRALARETGAFVTPVLLFVNASADLIEDALESVPGALLQFHGDEHEAACHRYGRPYLRAIRMAQGVDLIECERAFQSAVAILVDAPSDSYGGSGTRFDWGVLPAKREKTLVLAGGLDAGNVGEAISMVRPFAVDVSSGVEDAPGQKNSRKMNAFVAAVRSADEAVFDSFPVY
ncbi:MAG: phosphoribosylanthranilate isomerase [Burkholderiaceae bacterium]